jgi:hypothetical protein
MGLGTKASEALEDDSSCGNVGNETVKTTIEIADDLFDRAQRVARKDKTTFRALTEQGLRLVLSRKQAEASNWKWKPVVVGGKGKSKGFKNATWNQVRDAIYSCRRDRCGH